MAFTVGLTGGIGSGKSSVAEQFARLGVPVVDADAVAHALTAPGGAGMPAIAREFGPEFVTPEGALDRKRMRDLAFSDPRAKDRLEAILHPMIRDETDRLIREARGPYAILMVPLLFEKPALSGPYQRALVVDVPEELQVERVMKRSGLPPEQVRSIMAAQATRAQRLARATEVIDNTGTLAGIEAKVASLHQAYLEAARRWDAGAGQNAVHARGLGPPESGLKTDGNAAGGLGSGAVYGRESPKLPDADALIVYEYPLTEKIRTLLRLEDLFERVGHFIVKSGPLEHHMVLLTLFEIMEVTGRADLKSDLLQELERQKQVLASFRSNPDVSQDALSGVISEVEQASVALFNMTGKIGQYLRENEWLMSIKQRTGIPGGACEFDLPSYHYWLHRDAEARNADLHAWIGPLYPLRDGTAVVLKLLREGGKPSRQIAQQGTFSQMLGGRTSQMVRIRLPRETQFVPEISANKYALNVRFTAFGTEPRPRVAEGDVEFELTFCNL